MARPKNSDPASATAAPPATPADTVAEISAATAKAKIGVPEAPAVVTVAAPGAATKAPADSAPIAHSSPSRSVPPPVPRASVWPSLLGGVIAAGIGAGAVFYLFPDGWRSAVPDPAAAEQGARIAGLQAALEALQAEVDNSAGNGAAIGTIATRLDGAEATRRAEIAAAVAAATIAANEAATARADIAARLSALEKRPAAGGAVSASALEAFERELAGLRAALDQNRSAGAGAAEDIAAVAKAAEDRIAAAEAAAAKRAAKRAAEVAEAARNAAARAAHSHLLAAFSTGTSLERPLADLIAAGVTVPPDIVAKAGSVQTRKALEESFPEAARAALAAALRTEATGAGPMERIGAFLRTQTGARSLEPLAGGGADAVLSRAEAALRAGNLAEALGELAALPTDGQAAMAGWSAAAEARLAVAAALVGLAPALE